MNRDLLEAIKAMQGEPLYAPEDLPRMSERKLFPLMRSLDQQVRSIVSVRLEPGNTNKPGSVSSNLVVTNDMFGLNDTNPMGSTPFENGNSGGKRKVDDAQTLVSFSEVLHHANFRNDEEDGSKKTRFE